jgi:hypothetical protein
MAWAGVATTEAASAAMYNLMGQPISKLGGDFQMKGRNGGRIGFRHRAFGP